MRTEIPRQNGKCKKLCDICCKKAPAGSCVGQECRPMAFQYFIPNFRGAPARRAFGRMTLGISRDRQVGNRIVSRIWGGETYVPFSLNPEKLQVPSMPTKIFQKPKE